MSPCPPHGWRPCHNLLNSSVVFNLLNGTNWTPDLMEGGASWFFFSNNVNSKVIRVFPRRRYVPKKRRCAIGIRNHVPLLATAKKLRRARRWRWREEAREETNRAQVESILQFAIQRNYGCHFVNEETDERLFLLIYPSNLTSCIQHSASSIH